MENNNPVVSQLTPTEPTTTNSTTPQYNPFDKEVEAAEAFKKAQEEAERNKQAILDTAVIAIKKDKFRQKKSAKFDINAIQGTYSNLTLEQIPDNDLSNLDRTRRKLKIAMGLEQPKNTENILIAAVKLPVGITVEQIDEILRKAVGEDNFLTKDYFTCSNVEMKSRFRNIVQEAAYINTFAECNECLASAPYAEFREQAATIVRNEEESLS